MLRRGPFFVRDEQGVASLMTTLEDSAETYAARLEETLPTVRERIDRAAAAAGRPAFEVRLIAVTKGHPLGAVDAAVAAGLTDLGENRIEELEEKSSARVGGDLLWHMIGHVQGRKARRVATVTRLIHSVDSLRLAERLARVGAERGDGVSVLAQVNTSGEDAKSGFAFEGAVEVLHRVAELPGLKVEGLMTMAPFVEDDVTLGAAFSRLRDVRDALRKICGSVGPELSMGMTNDLEIAIREGSTMVRIGTALFGERAQGAT